jgi:sugar phosphate isomerase/epimerase
MLNTPYPLAIVAEALDFDPRLAAFAARKLGYDGMLFRARLRTLDLTELSGTGRREFLGVLRASNLSLTGLQFDLDDKGIGPSADLDQVLHRVNQLLETAAGLHAPVICIDLGPLPAPPAPPAKPRVSPQQAGLILLPDFSDPAPRPAPLPPASAFDAPFAAAIDQAMREFGQLADKYKTVLAFRSDLSEFAALQRALSAANCPWFGVDFDPTAVLRDAWDSDETFSQLGSLIRHVRARDAVVGADRRTKPVVVGAGSINWAKVYAYLNDAGYHGPVTVDPIQLPDRHRASVAAASFLRAL